MTLPRLLARWGGLVALAALLATVLATGVWRQLTPAAIQRNHTVIFNAVAAHPVTGVAVFFLVCAFVSATSLPGPGVLAVIGGALFGWFAGGLTAVTGFTLGALPTFFAFRVAAGRDEGGRDGRLGRLVERLRRNAFSTLLAIRLAPVAPIGVVTIAAGLGRVPLGAFVAATFLGCGPAALVFAAVGQGVRGAVERGGLISPRQFADPRIVIPLGLLALVAAVAAVVRLRRRP